MPALSTLFRNFFHFCGFPTTTRLKYAAEYGRIAYEIKRRQENPVNLTLTPDFMFARTADITPAFLKNNSIAALLCDIDNTLSPYEDAEPNDEICAWVKSMQAAGIALALISNNTPARVETYNAARACRLCRCEKALHRPLSGRGARARRRCAYLRGAGRPAADRLPLGAPPRRALHHRAAHPRQEDALLPLQARP